jgi:two-component system OmpR family response regulator
MLPRVLIVDDDPDVLRLGEVALGRVAGWSVLLADTSQRALEVACREEPDVILLDLRMPGRDGPSTLDDLKANARTAGIPIIVMSAAAHSEDARACVARGAAGVIQKPFDPIELPARIDRILRVHSRAVPA